MDSLRVKANEGNEDAQLKLGKCVLHQAEVGSNLGENARQAVNWLIRASRKGNVEATNLLRDCLSKQLGIDDSNLEDVTWCIKTTELEKRARKSAQLLFRKLSPFGQKKSQMTKEEYMERVSDFSTNNMEKKLLEKAGKSEIITEEDFVNRIFKRLEGRSGIAFNSFFQNDVEWEAYNSSSFYTKVTRYPGKTLVWILDSTVETAGSQGIVWLRSLLPINQIYMLVVLFIYSLISFAAFLWIIPLLGFYISFLCMTIFMMQMFYNKRKLRDVKALAEMLEKLNETFSQESAESAYSWSSLMPYISFFVSLPLTILMFSAADKTWIPCSELVLVAAVITVACFFALSDRYDYLAICSVLLDNISTLPVLIKGLPKGGPVIYETLQYVAGAGFSLEIMPQFFLQIGLPSLAYIIVPLLFLRMAMLKSWSGTYQVLVPHLVCFFWWRVTVMFFLYSSWYGLLRASVGWMVLVLLMPIVAVVFVLWILYVLFRAFSLASMLKLMTTFILLGGVGIFGYWSRGGFKIGSKDSKMTKVILALVLLFSSVPLACFFIPEETIQMSNYLPWETYLEHCGKPRWESSSVAEVMADCSHLTQSKVNWTGTVKHILIKRLENQAELFIDYLPTILGSWLKCTYGEEYPSDCNILSTNALRYICTFNQRQGCKCHLKNLNRYTYELSVGMENESGEVKLQASHWFKDVIEHIKQGDRILFRAYLSENLGNVNPVLRLYNLECHSCVDPSIEYSGTIFQQNTFNVILQGKHALQAVCNFFLSPVFTFKADSLTSSDPRPL